MKTALITIATREVYRNYVNQMIASAKKYFSQAALFIFTDNPLDIRGVPIKRIFQTSAKGHPLETLYRFHTLLCRPWHQEFDQMFWVDADMMFVAPVGDIFSDGLVATLHPGYLGNRGTPETRPESTAYCPNNTAYFCGGFQGGSTKAYMKAALRIKENIDIDAARGIKAIWNDESHWNKYLADNPPTRILSPAYCYPEPDDNNYYKNSWKKAGFENIEPILLALEKKVQ